jgi:hypothetical protein
MGETFGLCKRFVDIEDIPAAGRDPIILPLFNMLVPVPRQERSH